MKLKLNDQGHPILDDGHPVYVHEDGKEIAFDAPASLASITRLTRQLEDAQTQLQDTATRLNAFEGIDDPDKARNALSVMDQLDHKKLVEAGEIDQVKAEISKAFETKLNDIEKRAQTLEQQLYDEKIGGSFARSRFIADKLAIPADIARAYFGRAFKIEQGRIVAYDSTGEKIYSRTHPGELADFDEAFEVLVERYPHRDDILKGSGASGLNAAPTHISRHGANTLARAAFEALGTTERADFVREGGKIVA